MRVPPPPGYESWLAYAVKTGRFPQVGQPNGQSPITSEKVARIAFSEYLYLRLTESQHAEAMLPQRDRVTELKQGGRLAVQLMGIIQACTQAWLEGEDVEIHVTKDDIHTVWPGRDTVAFQREDRVDYSYRANRVPG